MFGPPLAVGVSLEGKASEMDMSEHEARFVVAAVMAHRLAARLGLSEADATDEYAKAVATMLAAEHGDARATITMVRAQEWIAATVATIRDGRDGKTIN